MTGKSGLAGLDAEREVSGEFVKLQWNCLRENLEPASSHRSWTTSEHEGIEVCRMLNLVTNNLECLRKAVNSTKRRTLLVANDTAREEEEDSLLNIRPLHVNRRLDIVDLRCLPRAFTESCVFFKTGINKLLDGAQLLLRSRSKLIPECNLLECDEREVRVVLGRKEVCVGLDDSFVAIGIKFPCAMYILVAVGVSLTEQESVRLSRGEVYDLP